MLIRKNYMHNHEPEVPSKVAIVTGAAHRIGANIARKLHYANFNVVVHYRSSKDAASSLTEELNNSRQSSAISLQADLQQPGSADTVTSAAIEQWGRLDLLVNNASLYFPTPVGEITSDTINSLFGTNVHAPLLLSQAAHPHLKINTGSVVNIVDIYGAVTHRNHSVYSASKAALSMLTKSLAADFAPDVRVNGISPGAILWPEGESMLTEIQKKEIIEKIPLARKGSASDIAEAVIYLVNAKFVTGQILTVDGGRTL